MLASLTSMDARTTIKTDWESPFDSYKDGAALAHQKGFMRPAIRTTGRARAEAAIIMADVAYNMKRCCLLDRQIVAMLPKTGSAIVGKDEPSGWYRILPPVFNV